MPATAFINLTNNFVLNAQISSGETSVDSEESASGPYYLVNLNPSDKWYWRYGGQNTRGVGYEPSIFQRGGVIEGSASASTVAVEYLSRYEALDLQGSSITYWVELILDWLMHNKFIIQQPAEVREYLIQHSDLTNVLLYICATARKRMGTQTQLSLEMYHDPEIKDEYLTLYARQQQYDEQILNLIEEICTQHEIALTNSSGWLLVTTDFQPPR